MDTRRRLISGLMILVLLAIAGCASDPVTVAPVPPAKYRILGKATGNACGSIGIVGAAYYFIPMGLNSRVERAYDRAIQSVPGATGLVNVELKDDWFWWLLASTRCTTVSGDAIKEEKK